MILKKCETTPVLSHYYTFYIRTKVLCVLHFKELTAKWFSKVVVQVYIVNNNGILIFW